MVRLTKQTDYALVLLTHMVQHGRDARWAAAELSADTGLPSPMVSKVLKALGRAGILQSHRGVKGGYSFDRQPEDISVRRVVEVFEGPLALTECTHPGGTECEFAPGCPTAGNWALINQAVARALGSLTLADMGRPMKHLPRGAGEPAMASTGAAGAAK